MAVAVGDLAVGDSGCWRCFPSSSFPHTSVEMPPPLLLVSDDPHRHERPNLLKASSASSVLGHKTPWKREGCFGGGIWTAWFQNPCKVDNVPCQSGVVCSCMVKGRQHNPQGWLLCSDSKEKWMISSNACTWGSAKSAQRTEAVSAKLREALQAMGGTQCSPPLGLKQCISCGTQALEWQAGHLCSITTTKHFLWPQFPPLPLRRVILNTDSSTTNLYSDRWKISNSLNWQGEGKSILYFH